MGRPAPASTVPYSGVPGALLHEEPPPASVPRPMAYTYDAAYAGVPNWEVGRPQRPFVRLADAGLVNSPVLDVGCGTGELSLFLAARGHDVLGIDLSGIAITQAREKARWRRSRAQFLVHDALRLGEFATAGLRFRTVLDSAMFHVLGDAERDRFLDGLDAVVERGGCYCVLGDARRDQEVVYGVTPAELRRRFAKLDGWELIHVEETAFERRWSVNRAYFAIARKAP